MISSSQFACTAAGIAPDPGLPRFDGRDDARCVFCGANISRCEPYENVRFGDKFTDYVSLAAPSSDLGCWGCHQARKTENGMLQIAAKAVYTPGGVFKSHSRAEQAYHLYHPPQGRFLWVMSISKAEHVVWRTPIALDRDRFPVRVGPHLIVVERQRVFDTLSYWQRALVAIQASDRKYANIVQPCESLDPDLMDAGSLRLKKWIGALGLSEVAELSEALMQLSTGDAWALSVLVLYHNRYGWDARPERPDRLFQ
jgi:CRISPR type IV-associated protein Csf1